MKKVKHWLHILLTILTSGLWLPVYLILLANTEMFNRGYREGKAAGRVQRQNEIDEERATPKNQWVSPPDPRTMPNCRCVVQPFNDATVAAVENTAKSKTMRYLDLCDLRRKGDIASWSPLHETEYQQLKTELQR